MQNEILYDHIFDAQQHYRLILDSMSRPGKINQLPELTSDVPAGINKGSVLIGFALLNTDVTFAVVDDEAGTVADFITLHTSATLVRKQVADFVFINGSRDNTTLVAEVKIGSLPYPEESATLIVDLDKISEQPFAGALQITLKGPGIKGTRTVNLSGMSPALLDAINEQNLEFPLGIDLMLTDRENNLICIPRSSGFSYQPTGQHISINESLTE